MLEDRGPVLLSGGKTFILFWRAQSEPHPGARLRVIWTFSVPLP